MKRLIFIILTCFASKIIAQKKDTTHIEILPQYPGGISEMAKFISKNIKYPKSARKKGIEGKCYLKFIVEKNGKADSVKVIKGVPNCIECDIAAIKVIEAMPLWQPATIDGVAVRCYFNIPISFKITEK